MLSVLVPKSFCHPIYILFLKNVCTYVCVHMCMHVVYESKYTFCEGVECPLLLLSYSFETESLPENGTHFGGFIHLVV